MVAGFVSGECVGRSVGQAKNTVTGLRSLLRYLHLLGVTPASLVNAVPAVAGWRGGSLPRALPEGQFEKLLGACDRRRRVGRRDFAILLLLARLGLRAGEVAALRARRHRLAGRRARGPRQGPPRGAAAAAGRRRRGARRLSARRRGRRARTGRCSSRSARRTARSARAVTRWCATRVAGRAWPGRRPPAAAHRRHRDAAGRGVAGRDRAGAAPPRAWPPPRSTPRSTATALRDAGAPVAGRCAMSAT